MPFRFSSSFAAAALCSASLVLARADGVRLVVQPERLELKSPDLDHGLLVTEIGAGGERTDVTRKASFSSSAPEIVAIEAGGHCRGKSNGAAEIAISFDGMTVKTSAIVSDATAKQAPSFKQDVLPILTRSGCNMGGCHGKLAGQNGFRLSLRGYAPEWDYDWITKEVNGRRINEAFPEESLLIEKPSGGVAHEGGNRFKPHSRYWQTLVDWVAARAPGPVANEENAERVEILPGDRLMRTGETQQLLVRAVYASGRTRDVTWLSQFYSNDGTTVSVKPDGVLKALRSGETSVRVHFQGQVSVIRVTIPYATDVARADFARTNNVLDAGIFKKLEALHVPPSPDADDCTFIRRAFLDAIGVLPTPEEVASFEADHAADKRTRLVDALLNRPEWVDYWTLEIADLLQNRRERDHDVRGTKGVRAFHAWLRSQVAANRPWSEIARAVLLARGDTSTDPEIGYFVTLIGEKEHVEESDLPDSAAQSFLGTRIGCARCHNHPLEKYTQDDFYHFAAYFAKTSLKRQSPDKGPTDLRTMTRDESEARKRLAEEEVRAEEAQRKAALLGEEAGGVDARQAVVESNKKMEVARKQVAEAEARPPTVGQPRTGQRIQPRPLDGAPWTFDPKTDPREQLVDWMLKSDLFSGAIVNRLWKHFFKVGLVEPVDDLRASNPPSNPELWVLLKSEFVAHNYDLKHIMRLILTSRGYQLSSDTLAGNEMDSKFYSHYYARRLPAEVLLDAIAAATDAPTQFAGYPVGVRAVQLPDPAVSSYFLTLFGRSERVTACACERNGEVTLPQLLHLHNGDEMQRQIGSSEGRVAALSKQTDDRAVIAALFRAAIARDPSDAEIEASAAALASGEREAVFHDIFWALLNSKEFTFNH